MAANNATDPSVKDHVKTYTGFLTVTKWAIILIAIVLIGLFAFVFGN